MGSTVSTSCAARLIDCGRSCKTSRCVSGWLICCGTGLIASFAPQEFRDFYSYSFNFAKDPGYGVRTLGTLLPAVYSKHRRRHGWEGVAMIHIIRPLGLNRISDVHPPTTYRRVISCRGGIADVAAYTQARPASSRLRLSFRVGLTHYCVYQCATRCAICSGRCNFLDRWCVFIQEKQVKAVRRQHRLTHIHHCSPAFLRFISSTKKMSATGD